MKLVICDKGHYYDGDIYESCPHCGYLPPVADVIPSRIMPAGIHAEEDDIQEPVQSSGRSVKPEKRTSESVGADMIEQIAARDIQEPAGQDEHRAARAAEMTRGNSGNTPESGNQQSQSANGQQNQSANGQQNQSANGQQSQSANGQQSQSANGQQSQSANGQQSQSANGQQSDNTEGSRLIMSGFFRQQVVDTADAEENSDMASEAGASGQQMADGADAAAAPEQTSQQAGAADEPEERKITAGDISPRIILRGSGVADISTYDYTKIYNAPGTRPNSPEAAEELPVQTEPEQDTETEAVPASAPVVSEPYVIPQESVGDEMEAYDREAFEPVQEEEDQSTLSASEDMAEDSFGDGYSEEPDAENFDVYDDCAELPAGWLVCIDREGCGTQLTLYFGASYIGFEPESFSGIQAGEQPELLDRVAALIEYDPVTCEFLLTGLDGEQDCLVNGRSATDRCRLCPMDMLTVAGRNYIFAALCGRGFTWQ